MTEQTSDGGLTMEHHEESFKIYVRNYKNKRFSLEVKPSNTVEDIKTKISRLKGVGIVAGSTLDLIQKPVMRIIIKALCGKTWPLIVGEHATTKDAMTMFEELTGVRTWDQRLNFEGHQLLHADKLSVHGVGRDSELHLTLRLGGSAPAPKCC